METRAVALGRRALTEEGEEQGPLQTRHAYELRRDQVELVIITQALPWKQRSLQVEVCWELSEGTQTKKRCQGEAEWPAFQETWVAAQSSWEKAAEPDCGRASQVQNKGTREPASMVLSKHHVHNLCLHTPQGA